MKLEDQARLSYYIEQELYTSNEKDRLVKHSIDGGIFVKKVRENADANVYKLLQKKGVSGIPKIYELVEDGSTTITIEEYISGSSLDKYIEKNGPLDEKSTIKIATKLCTILEKISHIVSRDVTPYNIMISDDGTTVHLVDFDTAVIAGANSPREKKHFGTVHFAAPEQYGFGEIGPQVDVYGLGATMSYMLTGKFPDEEPYQGNKLLEDVIRLATSVDPKHRLDCPADMKDMLNGKRIKKRKFLPPGFRKGKLSHKIVATIYYILAFFLAGFCSSGETYTGFKFLVERIIYRGGLFVYFLIVPALWCNYLNIWGKLDLPKNPILRSLIILACTVTLFFGAFILMGIFESILLK